MKPLIGITTYYVNAYELGKNHPRGLPDQDMSMSTMDYARAIEKAGGIPITIPLINDENYIDSIVEKCDGILFSGGADVTPSYYGETYKKGLGKVNPARDKFELNLLEKAIQKNKSIMGICRGFQIINVYFGGTLYQDINNANISKIEHVGLVGPKNTKCHKVILKKDLKIYNAFNKKEIMVNSFHHQAVKTLGKGLVCAQAEDGIIEAVEKEDYPFLVAVQWHPEMMFETDTEQFKLFKIFIDSI